MSDDENFEHIDISYNINTIINEPYYNNIPYNEEKYERNNYTQLEWDTLHNNYELICKIIQEHNTLYVCKNNILCNGLYYLKYKKHPNKCKPMVCYRSAIYYAFKNNCRIYMTIYRILLLLQEHIPELRKSCPCCKTKEDITELNKFINNILNDIYMLQCECRFKYSYKKYYTSEYLNFKYIHNIFCKNLSQTIMQLQRQYLKKHIKPIIKLEKYDNCLHENMKKITYNFCKNNNNTTTNQQMIDKYISELIEIEELYQTNVKIIILLLNQQMFEFYRYKLTTVSEMDIIDDLKYIIPENDIYININYEYENNNILELTLQHKDYNKLVQSLIEKEALINNNTFLDILEKGYYNSALILINTLTPKQINYTKNNKNALYIIINDDNLNILKKTEYIKLLLQKGFDANIKIYDQNILSIIIQLNDTYEIVKLIIENKVVPYKIITSNNISTAILANKTDILKLLLDNYTLDDKSYIFTYLNGEYDNSILDTILDYIPDINNIYDNNIPLLIKTCHAGKKYALDKFIKKGIKLDVYDDYNNSCINISVKNNHIELLDYILNCKTNDEQYIINIPNKYGHTPIITAIYTKEPQLYIKKLLNHQFIEIDYYDKNGLNILDHLFENTEILYDTKKNILTRILKHINLTDINNNNQKSSLIRAVEKNEYEFVLIMFTKLIESGKIKLMYDDHETTLHKSFIVENVNVMPTFDCKINYYSLVYNYLKNNYNTNKSIFNKSEPKKDVRFIEIYIISVMLFTLILINKK